MAMTLRPVDAQRAAIAQAARVQGKSMQRLVIDAAMEAATRHERRRSELRASFLVEDGEASTVSSTHEPSQ